MLFNSFEFIFIFLPVVVWVYFLLNKRKLTTLSKYWLTLSSLFFYSWWNIYYLPLLLFSIIINYRLGKALTNDYSINKRKTILSIGILINVSLLGYYKYADFFIENINILFKSDIPFLNLALPLAISFFTFQQIAYLVDTYRKDIENYSFNDYCLFVTFFPQLIAGPIVHHKEVMPQFTNLRKKIINYKNLAIGSFLFSIGLFKKVMLADSFAQWANQGFDVLEKLTFIEAWIVSLSYTFQLYFDFSGYMDMASGAALLFNITLPINFYSPYKALNIQEVWSKWHMTLGRFLYKYIYTPMNKALLRKVFKPLGLNKQVMVRTNISLMLLYIISGIWHGAGWTFVVWGLIHGIATVTHRLWKSANFKMNKLLAWIITFNFINFSMVFFRASSFEDVYKILKGMIGLEGIVFPSIIYKLLPFSSSMNSPDKELSLTDGITSVKFLIFGFILILCFKNSSQLKDKYKANWFYFLFTISLLLISILYLTRESEFIYFNF
jgi:alginate O-acetyltransferase complex protein AlgI